MTKELKRFEKWWDAEDDIPNNGPYTPDTPIQFAWAGWQAALAQPEQEPMHPELRKMWEDYFDKCFRRKPLSDEVITRIGMTHQGLHQVARAIEAAHGIKENT